MLLGGLMIFSSGCHTPQMSPNLVHRRHLTNGMPSEFDGERIPYAMPPGKKKLLVFMDGTNNKEESRTNVRRLFEMIGGEENPQHLCLYVPGVGADWRVVVGNGFGGGMQDRICDAYKFLSEYYVDGDEIYIFGFSRGSHQARALAGLIAHCGLLQPNDRERACDMIDWSNKSCEGVSEEDWRWAVTTRTPLYPGKLVCDPNLVTKFNSKFKGVTNRYAEVTFLGVWDTVPGSVFVDFGPAEELEGGNVGIRYKMGAYPPIRKIAHAVSLEERRKKFRPVLFPLAIDPAWTTVYQEWFPGVHSDIGGGYPDSSELSGVTLNWMLDLLQTNGLFTAGLPKAHAPPAGLMHDEWTDSRFWRLWKSEHRWRPADAVINPSAASRASSGPVWIHEKSSRVFKTNYTIIPSASRPVEWPAGSDLSVSAAIRKPAHALPGSKPNEFIIAPWQPWNLTGFRLEAGKKYVFTARAEPDEHGFDYSDASHRCSPDGPMGFGGRLFDFRFRNPHFYNPLRWLGPGRNPELRVLKDRTCKRASFLTVIGAIGMNDCQCNVFVIGSQRTYTAHATGELVVFCNDWPGGCGATGDARFSNSPTYANNTGLIRLTVEEVK